ncbi:MAG TPA: hypothetical protein VGH76_24395 [Actinomycetospora sp.]|jgi:hypothetical protein|uniref:hypothetical protein n=1 Tax=Actinomycetospora sp. TaxID=1872135 RepID=UPI002F424C49
MSRPTVDANLYSFTGPDHRMVTISPSLDGSPQVSYHDTHQQQVFVKDEVLVDDTAMGRLVTVTLARTVDLGSTTFSVVLPEVRLPASQSLPVTTVAVTAVHRTSLAAQFDVGQRDSYSVSRLHGTASFVET